MIQSAPIETASQDKNIQLQELALVLTAKNLKPTLLNPDALTVAGIIPSDWELARQPVVTPQVAQLSYKNGVNLLAQGNTLTLSEGIRPQQTVQVPTIASQYVAKMNNADYRSVSISPKVLIGFATSPEDTARRFIVDQLVAPGPWKEISQQPMQAKVEFSYPLDRCVLTLAVIEARIAQDNQPTLPAILFNSNFTYALSEAMDAQARVQLVQSRVGQWMEDWKMFQEIIQQRFLSQLMANDSIFRT